jgi:hypothetical protein
MTALRYHTPPQWLVDHLGEPPPLPEGETVWAWRYTLSQFTHLGALKLKNLNYPYACDRSGGRSITEAVERAMCNYGKTFGPTLRRLPQAKRLEYIDLHITTLNQLRGILAAAPKET